VFIIEEDEGKREEQKKRALKLSQFYKEEGLYKDAIRSYELYIFLEGKDNVDYNVFKELGVCYSLMGQNDEAIKKLEKAHEINGIDNKVIYLLAQMYEQNSDYQKAELFYTKVKPKDSNEEVSIYYSIGDIALRQGEILKAIENFSKVVEFQPTNGHTYYVLGELYYTNGNMNDAERCFRVAHERGIKKVGLYNYLGQIFMKRDDFENAKINFLIAAGKEESVSKYYKNYLKCLNNEEVEIEEKVLGELQDYDLLKFRMALLEMYKGNIEKSKEILEKLAEEDLAQVNLKKSIRDELNEIYSIKR
jgi:tetratricopeptide (TPR) repeat protein